MYVSAAYISELCPPQKHICRQTLLRFKGCYHHKGGYVASCMIQYMLVKAPKNIPGKAVKSSQSRYFYGKDYHAGRKIDDRLIKAHHRQPKKLRHQNCCQKFPHATISFSKMLCVYSCCTSQPQDIFNCTK